MDKTVPTQEQYQNLWLWIIFIKQAEAKSESYDDTVWMTAHRWPTPSWMNKGYERVTHIGMSKKDGTVRMMHESKEIADFWDTCEALGVNPNAAPDFSNIELCWTYPKEVLPARWIEWMDTRQISKVTNKAIKTALIGEVDRIIESNPKIKKQLMESMFVRWRNNLEYIHYGR